MQTRLLTAFVFLGFWLALLEGCATSGAVAPKPIDPAAIKSIGFRIESATLGDLGVNADTEALASRVRANLRSWRFPLNEAAPSHMVTARILPVEFEAATPAGFSFSMGGSDPRAVDYQKADVLPIDCVLTAAGSDDLLAELSMGFTDNSLSLSGKHRRFEISSDKLVDHVSTVCFNLLDQIPWPEPAAGSGGGAQTFKPAWMPEIRIETKTVPEPGFDDKALTAKKPAAVRTETSKKQLIIHNQGSPIIIHFGHERR